MSGACLCPVQYPNWHGEDVDLGGHCVHVLAIPAFFHMPIAYELYPRRQNEEIQQLALHERWPGLVLTRTGWFRGKIIRLLEDTRSPSHHVQYLPRPFRVRAYLHEGDVGTMAQPVRQMQMDLLDSGRMPRELYLCYLTCPLCASERGGSRILLLRRWTESKPLKRRQARH